MCWDYEQAVCPIGSFTITACTFIDFVLVEFWLHVFTPFTVFRRLIAIEFSSHVLFFSLFKNSRPDTGKMNRRRRDLPPRTLCRPAYDYSLFLYTHCEHIGSFKKEHPYGAVQSFSISSFSACSSSNSRLNAIALCA